MSDNIDIPHLVNTPLSQILREDAAAQTDPDIAIYYLRAADKAEKEEKENQQ